MGNSLLSELVLPSKESLPLYHFYRVSLEPLSLPFFLGFGIYSVWKTWESLAKNNLTLHEVNLKRDGIHVEIGFLSYIGREAKKQKFTMNIKDLSLPPLYEDSYPLAGDLFPTLIEEFELEDENPSVPWVKYCDVIRARMLLPKNYDFMDKQLMVAIMNGNYIDTTNY